MADKHLFPQTIVNWQSWYVARIRPHVEYVDECEPTRVDSENGNYEVFECREEWLEVLRSLLEKGKKNNLVYSLLHKRAKLGKSSFREANTPKQGFSTNSGCVHYRNDCLTGP